LAAEQRAALDNGVHLIAVQSADGSLVVGDSHHYGETLDPDIHNARDHGEEGQADEASEQRQTYAHIRVGRAKHYPIIAQEQRVPLEHIVARLREKEQREEHGEVTYHLRLHLRHTRRKNHSAAPPIDGQRTDRSQEQQDTRQIPQGDVHW
jgi:hypothetical protein